MSKKIFNGLICLIVMILITGCGISSFNNDSDSYSNGSLIDNGKGNCKVEDCINLIDPEDTVEEINKIIGFAGELIDEKYNIYYWELSEESGVKVAYYSGNKGTISIDFDRNNVSDNNVDFSKYEEIKTLLNNGTSLTYDQFVNKVGNVQGTLIEKSSYTKKYVWVNSDGGYLNASFSESSGKCTIVTGRY